MSGSQKRPSRLSGPSGPSGPSGKTLGGGASKPVRAFVLVQTIPGRVAAIIRALEKMTPVKGVDPVTGPFDIVVYLEVGKLSDISGVVAGTIGGLKGVTHTTTLLCV